MPHSGIFNGHMSTITGHPSGFTEASKLHDRTGKEALPELSVALPESGDPQNSNQDLGIREQPSWAEMQIWSNNRLAGGQSLAALIAPKLKKRTVTPYTQRPVNLSFNLGTVNDSFIAPAYLKKPWEGAPDERSEFSAVERITAAESERNRQRTTPPSPSY